MTRLDHFTDDLLIQVIDDELPPSEIARIQSHLKVCVECYRRYKALRALTLEIGSLVAETSVDDAPGQRKLLVERLEAHGNSEAALRRGRQLLAGDGGLGWRPLWPWRF